MILVVPQHESPVHSGQQPIRRTIAGATVATVVALALAWWFTGSVLATDRGLELSDEGLYLLAADPPSPVAAWGFPFGWHVRPLFILVGYDIASFRTLGAVILLACSAWLGLSAGRVSLSACDRRPSPLILGLTAVSGALGCLLFYAPMLRTPSYNWLNLLGITVATAATLTLIAQRRFTGERTWPHTVGLAAIASLALFFTIPAKPSTPPIMLALTVTVVVISRGPRPALAWAAASVAMFPVWLLAAYLIRLWPVEALDVFRLAVGMPAPDPLQTTGAAIRAALMVPVEALQTLLAAPLGVLTVVAVGLCLAAMPTLFNRPWAGLRIIGFLVAAVAALAIAGVPVPGLRETFEPFRIANADVTTACLVVLLAAIVAALPRGQMVRFDAASGGRARWSAIALLGVLPFVFAFGSGNGIYAQASLASGFLLLAAVVCVPRPRSWPQGASLTVSAAITVLAFATAAIISGWQAPFRSSPLTEQTSRTPVGTHGAVLLLDSRRSATITQLQSRAEAVGWKNGTPVIDVSFTWNPAIPYALGGRVPDFLALTIFGYPAAHAVTDFHLSEPYREFPFEEAWLITSRPASISDPTGQAGVDFTIDKLEKVTGRAFPSSYACVMAGDFILWRPATNPQGAGLDCAG